MFLKLKRSMVPNNTTIVVESSIWTTLIPSHLESLDYIDNFNDNENDEDEDDDDDDLSPMPVESEEANYMC
jgi:hypothetical protein